MRTVLDILKSLPFPDYKTSERLQFIEQLPALGINQQSIPELIAIINDKNLYEHGSDEDFLAQVYAADALAGLKAKEALPHLFAQLYRTEWQYDDDWISSYSHVFFWYGTDIIPDLTAQLKLAAPEHVSPLVEALVLFVKAHPEYRNDTLAALDQLYERLLAYPIHIDDESFSHPAHTLISAWMDLMAADKIAQIRHLHTKYEVEEMLFGSIPYIEYELGLGPKPRRAVTPDFVPFVHAFEKPGRNDPCICGSGKKFKKCCIDKLD